VTAQADEIHRGGANFPTILNGPRLPKAYDRVEARWANMDGGEAVCCADSGERRSERAFSLMLPPPECDRRLHMGTCLNQTGDGHLTRCTRHRFLRCGCRERTTLGCDRRYGERQLGEGQSRITGAQAFLHRVWEWKSLYGGAFRTR